MQFTPFSTKIVYIIIVYVSIPIFFLFLIFLLISDCFQHIWCFFRDPCYFFEMVKVKSILLFRGYVSKKKVLFINYFVKFIYNIRLSWSSFQFPPNHHWNKLLYFRVKRYHVCCDIENKHLLYMQYLGLALFLKFLQKKPTFSINKPNYSKSIKKKLLVKYISYWVIYQEIDLVKFLTILYP